MSCKNLERFKAIYLSMLKRLRLSLDFLSIANSEVGIGTKTFFEAFLHIKERAPDISITLISVCSTINCL
jgi:hypothetical protein